MRASRFAVPAAFALPLALAAQALAADPTSLVTTYDRTFTQAKGEKSFTDTFTAPTTKGTWYVTVEADTGLTARVALNGARVISEDDDRKDDGARVLRKVVSVNASDTITVSDLDGKSGLHVRVHVDGVVPTSALPAGSGTPVSEIVLFSETFSNGTTTKTIPLTTTSGLYWVDLTASHHVKGKVTFNGSVLLGEDDLSEKDETVTVPVLVTATNTLVVKITEPKDATLKVSLRGWVPSTTSAPPAPTNLVASAVSQAQINLTWTASSGATGYVVSRGTQSGGPYAQIGSVAGTSFQDTGLVAATTYYYVVQATNAGGTSPFSAEASATTLPNPPQAPTNVAASAVSQTQINVTWTAASGATSYVVSRGTQSGGPYTQVGTPTTTTFQDAGLTANTTYYYVVQAVNAGGTSTNSSQASATTLPNAASPPTNLTATTVSQTQINVTWNASSGATSYVVSRGAQSGGPYTQVGTTSSTSFQDTGLTANTTYYYVVQARNAGGTSANSTQASATTLPNAPSPPTNVTATTVSQTQINVMWTASSGATSYVVSRGTQSGGPYSQIGTTSTTSFQDTGLTANTTYYYVVQAVNAGGSSANSSQASATTLPNAPSPPTNVTATTVSQTQ
ncbi:MAG TPA: fibronectin type III domain-containing protein, partial [Planctomycetota bacterium]|nr:fibronectin type III domain-containing protein [Planctomycetota bacterium]